VTSSKHSREHAGSGLRSRGRRQVLRLLGAGAVLLVTTPGWTRAGGRGAWERIEPARELLGGTTPREDAIALDLPVVSQDGSSIPLRVEIESPMTAEDHIETLYLFAADNPAPELAEIRFTPLTGKARIDTRIRLDRSQTVLALARTSRGEWLGGQRDVRVTVSGCFARADTYQSENVMQTRVRAPGKLAAGELGDVRTLINHPMETGLREDEHGRTIPQRIVEYFEATMDGEAVLTARLYRAISANPYLRFPIAPRTSGELVLRWREDSGREAAERTSIAVG
jgi:sulfur-oxidizing protein SoxY